MNDRAAAEIVTEEQVDVLAQVLAEHPRKVQALSRAHASQGKGGCGRCAAQERPATDGLLCVPAQIAMRAQRLIEGDVAHLDALAVTPAAELGRPAAG